MQACKRGVVYTYLVSYLITSLISVDLMSVDHAYTYPSLMSVDHAYTYRPLMSLDHASTLICGVVYTYVC